MLFANATPRQARVMKGCLESFCKASGQTVNFDISKGCVEGKLVKFFPEGPLMYVVKVNSMRCVLRI